MATAKKQPVEAADDTPPKPVQIAPLPAPAPKIMKVCGTCKGWIVNPRWPCMGQCIPSSKHRQSPLETMDLVSCSDWAPR